MWRDGRTNELALIRAIHANGRIAHEDLSAMASKERELALAGKLTGRQLFLKDATLNLSDVALIEQSVEIDESLFDEEIDGLDIDSDED
ncbi:hypothetical protein TELCIR_14613 [Teladorsagia circumcincta]|uniref:Uncharacterized protein n=1 Tax=Teladorsagia circumcincta TaxID=45464 RepID=A0A2G9U0P3_TELCI|nr:hypothetical protein TELCIR_14613 [Teladorsagia circumcincta]